MSTERNIYSFAEMRKVVHLLLWFALLTCVKYGQAAENQNDKSPYGKTPEVIAGLKTCAFGPVTERRLLKLGLADWFPCWKRDLRVARTRR